MSMPASKYLHYTRFGSGTKYLLAFHGFGQDHSVFRIFGDSLGREYTILSFDLFFHGQSNWPADDLPIPPLEWKNRLGTLLNQEKIDTFSMMGFSLGGKIAIATSLLFPGRVETLILAAPDGVFISPWYKLATGSALMRRVFRHQISHPRLVLSIIPAATSLRLFSKNFGEFITQQMTSKSSRKRIYLSWVGFRLFTHTPRAVVSHINAEAIRLIMVAGHYDSVIPHRHLEAFTAQCTHGTWLPIKTGHQSLLAKYHRYLMGASID